MLRHGTKSKQTEKQDDFELQEARQKETEDIDDLIFRDCCDNKTHSER